MSTANHEFISSGNGIGQAQTEEPVLETMEEREAYWKEVSFLLSFSLLQFLTCLSLSSIPSWSKPAMLNAPKP